MTNEQYRTLMEIGVISRPHGITGEVKVHTPPAYLQALDGVKHIYLNGSSTATHVLSHRIHQNAILLRLDGVETRNDAEALRGKRVAIKADELPKLGEGEYYAHDLVGLRVIDNDGRDLGAVAEVLATGSNDVYIVRSAEGKELLLPAIESVIRKIDLEARTLSVVVPDGLSS